MLLTKSMNLKFISLSFSIDSHIIPAREPSGVNMVVRLELIIVAKLAINEEPVGNVVITEDINTLIGILLIRFPNKNENMPYPHSTGK